MTKHVITNSLRVFLGYRIPEKVTDRRMEVQTTRKHNASGYVCLRHRGVSNDLLAAQAHSRAGEVLIREEGVQSHLVI